MPAKLKLQFFDDGEPRADEPYVLNIDGRFRTGNLDGEGRLETSIPPTARRAEITFEGEDPVQLKLGSVDPITEVSGVQGRLNNLGFNAGAIDNVFGPKTRRAIRRFQFKHKLEVTEEIDEPTKNKLLEVHGC